MSDTQVRKSKQFGRRKEPQTITISSNGRSRQYRIPGSIVVLSVCLFSMFMVGYVVSTAYLAFRDDLISSSIVRQARIKHEYEDRIAALRSKVDKITSRQLLDQQAVEAQVADLVKQQEMLSGRSGELNGLFERAKKNGIGISNIPVPAKRPLNSDVGMLDPQRTGSISIENGFRSASASSVLRGSYGTPKTNSNLTGPAEMIASAGQVSPSKRLFGAVVDQMQNVKLAQFAKIKRLHHEAHQKSAKIVNILDDLNIPVSEGIAANIGGPYEAERSNSDFKGLAEDLNGLLSTLDGLKNKTQGLPIANPVASPRISSSFGNRVDPFYKKTAFHSGVDFKASTGTPIKATGDGVVVTAERSGGYGLTVVIDHGSGINTRYAHMSKILVNAGQNVSRGKIIGKVGSTGRSTGAHLHYEIRRNEEATNPSKFLKAGAKLNALL